MNRPSASTAFTLVEWMIVVAVWGVRTSLASPWFQPSSLARLQATAEVVAADIAFARSMAVSRSSEYTLTFDLDDNAYVLEHTGSRTALDNLPSSPFHYNDSATERSTQLNDLPGWGAAAQLAVIYAQPDSGSSTKVTTLEFGPLGATTRSESTIVWLKNGSGTSQRYIWIEIDPVTGLESIGEVTDTLPAST